MCAYNHRPQETAQKGLVLCLHLYCEPQPPLCTSFICNCTHLCGALRNYFPNTVPKINSDASLTTKLHGSHSVEYFAL